MHRHWMRAGSETSCGVAHQVYETSTDSVIQIGKKPGRNFSIAFAQMTRLGHVIMFCESHD